MKRTHLPLALFGLSACAAVDYQTLAPHLVAVDADGVAYDPATDRPLVVEQHIRRILDQMGTAPVAKATAGSTATPPKRRIMIHVHGGLNSSEISLAGSAAMLKRMQQETDPDDQWYPIFVTWPSGFFSTWWEHLTLLRQGRHATIWGPITSPLALLSDMVSAGGQAPMNLMGQIGTDVAVAAEIGFDTTVLPSWRAAETTYQALQAEETPWKVYRGTYSRGALVQTGAFFLYWITFAPCLLTGTFGLEGMGQGAWDSMLHRARNLFRTYEEFSPSDRDSTKTRARATAQPPQGAFAELLRALATQIGKDRDQYEIALVVHSMGSIIVNDALRYLEEERLAAVVKGEVPNLDLPISHIVYMAPACSIDEAAAALVPYLQSHPSTRFHLLTLHPLAEAEELNGYGLVPRGSLLEWVDTYFSRPAGPLERRFGKWVNAIVALPMFRTVAKQVEFKAFDVEGGSKPQQHGDFNLSPFWKRSFWNPEIHATY